MHTQMIQAKGRRFLAGFAVLLVTAIFSFSLAGCDIGNIPGNDSVLSGSIVISTTPGGTTAAAAATTGETLYAVYNGTETVTYRWNKGGAAISGETNSSYTPAEAGSYTVTVSAPGYQSKTSVAVTVTLSPLSGTIVISTTSGGTTAVTTAETGDTLYAVYRGGSEAVTYQWNKDGTIISGETGSSYMPAEAGSYTVTVGASNYQSKASAAVVVTGAALSPLSGTIVISAASGGTTAAAAATTGDTLYAVYSGGTETVSYQWNKDGTIISGETGNSYTPTEAGSYTVTVSASGYLRKTSAPVIVSAPALSGTIVISAASGGTTAVTTAETGDTLYAVYSGGTETVTYQWNKDGAAISGETGSSYTPTEAGSYTVTVSAAGYQSETSGPVIVSAPALSGTIVISATSGGTVITTAETGDTLYAVYSGGTETVSYQWNRGGTAVSGETNSSYTPAEAGSYTVTVSAAGYRSETSAAVAVTGGSINNDTNIVGDWKIVGDNDRFSFTGTNSYVFTIGGGLGTFSGPYTYTQLDSSTARLTCDITNATGFASGMVGGKYDVNIQWDDNDNFTVVKINSTSPAGGPTVGEKWERVTGDDDDESDGPDNWSALVGEWEWTDGYNFILLEFHAEKKKIFGYTGPGYSFEEWYDVGSSMGWGDLWFCSYDGTTLRRYDEKNVTECTWTVTKSGDGRTITFSNYKDADDPSKTNRLSGKTFTRQP